MIQKLLRKGVNNNLILWIYDFLTSRPQYVRHKGVYSDVKYTNTGAPQGCVISPVLFTIYTDHFQINDENGLMVKYADDTAIESVCHNGKDEHYDKYVSGFAEWCEKNDLGLNVPKTTEMIIDFRKSQNVIEPVVIKGEEVEQVDEYKYLGTIMDNKLSWNPNTIKLSGKGNQRMYFLRKLRSFRVDSTILQLFYQAVVQSAFSFGIIVWFQCLTKNDRRKLDRIQKWACVVTGCELTTVYELYVTRVKSKVESILKDNSHPLHDEFVLLRSGRRYRMPKIRTSRYHDTFVPTAIKMINDKVITDII